MKILVCISRTPETTAKIGFSADQSAIDSNGLQYIMNPYDEWYALVRAVELKEKHGGSVSVINVGAKENDTVIRKALAIGADNAVRVDATPTSGMGVAFQIAQHAKTESYDLIFCGKESIDYNGSEVGAMLSEYLDLPFISFATSLEVTDQTASLEREIEGGSEVVEVALPFVVSAAKGMAEQRIPNMRGIMMAKRKPLKAVESSGFNDKSKVVSYEAPQAKSAVKMVDPENMEELVRLLKEEAKVI